VILASSDHSTDPVAAGQLGRLLTGTEARQLADRLADGDTVTVALKAILPARRPVIRALMSTSDVATLIAILRAVEGSRAAPTSLSTLWTLPGHLAQSGRLTSSLAHLVQGARQSVTCSTFNFQRSSALWTALREAATRPELTVRVYVDAAAAGRSSRTGTPTTVELADHLLPATVLRTKTFAGRPVRNHAKFLAIDHRLLLVTSANFSWSAEHRNIEFGVLVDDRGLTETVERELRDVEPLLYEQVLADIG
jgi:hypothetical protein